MGPCQGQFDWDEGSSSRWKMTSNRFIVWLKESVRPVWSRLSRQPLIRVGPLDRGKSSQSLLDKYKLMSRCQAVRAMHFPKDLAEYKQALRRIKFEELFYFQMQLQSLKSENRVQGSGLVLKWSKER